MAVTTASCSSVNSKVQAVTPVTVGSTASPGRPAPVSVNFVVGPNEVVQGVRFVLSGDVLFDVDSTQLSTVASQALSKVLAAAARYASASFLIEGHTDADGDEAYNQDLSVRRAHAVAGWFLGKGIPVTAITATGWGKTKPVAPNDTPENKARNRRVEITLKVSR